MYAIIDCDNCYVSCERIFRPDLNGKPVCVLSNNDGCVVARSNEAKALGIKAGLPYYQLKERFPNGEVTVFSSNYELYGDITDRVMSLVRKAAPTFYRYSIDEGFCDLSGYLTPPLSKGEGESTENEAAMSNVQSSMFHIQSLKQWGEDLSAFIWKATRMPVSIGIAPTKTLAKMASHYAKHYKGYNHCCMIGTEEQRLKALKQYDIEEVWGIGRRYAARLQMQGIQTALDFASHAESWVRATLNNVVAIRTWKELNGIDCVPMEDMSKKKSICTSRSFPGMVTDIETIRTSISNFAARCAEKLRKQNSVAQTVCAFIDTNHFREDLPQYWNMREERLLTPSNSTQMIVQTANRCLKGIFRQGYHYKRAGVIVMGICPDNSIQTNFIDYDAERFEKLKRIDEVLDRINREYGSETIVLGSQQYTAQGGKGQAGRFKDSIKHDFRSPCYTTRWSDIPEAT
jgi:DNA polymerase V